MGLMDDVRKITGGHPQEPKIQLVSTRDEGVIETLHDIKLILADMADKANVPEPVGENMTLLQGADVPFDAHGYKYNAIVVSDADKNNTIKVTIGGVTYTQSLVAGVNQTNFPDGCRLVASANTSIHLIRTNYEFKTS